MTALDTLTAHYGDPGPAIREWRSGGGRVVAYVGADVPRELVAAAGFLPVRLRGDGPSSQLADEILGPRVDPAIRAILARLLDPAEDRVDHLLLCHDCDSTVRLYTSLRVLARLPEGAVLPDVHFVDLLHLPTRTTASYNLDRVRELADVLARWSGRPVSEDALRAAIAEANETRRLLVRLQALRRGDPPCLRGADALAAIGAGTALPAGAYNSLLGDLLEEVREPLPPGRRVYLSGSGQVATAVYDAIEADGAVVVGEDHDWGEGLADGLVEEAADPFEALAARHHVGSALGRRHGSKGTAGNVAREAAAAGADVVVDWIRTGDDARAWDIPELRGRLEERGIPLLVLDHQGLEPAGAIL